VSADKIRDALAVRGQTKTPNGKKLPFGVRFRRSEPQKRRCFEKIHGSTRAFHSSAHKNALSARDIRNFVPIDMFVKTSDRMKNAEYAKA